jgi:hypothetical protein
LTEQTTACARILWEDRPEAVGGPRWTALLPVLTGRAFVGGLDPDAVCEYARNGLVGHRLAGRPLAEWADGELEEFCQRYNVGWVACWSPAAVARFAAWSGAEPGMALAEGGKAGRLFRLRREPSFVLKGEARWLQADRRRILLGDVVPVDGKVVLSLHYQAGMVCSPSRVRVEPDPDPDGKDLVPFVRLRVPGPVTRLTLMWADP